MKRMDANTPNLKNPDSGKCNEWRSSLTVYRRKTSVRIIPEKFKAHNVYTLIFNAINVKEQNDSIAIRREFVLSVNGRTGTD